MPLAMRYSVCAIFNHDDCTYRVQCVDFQILVFFFLFELFSVNTKWSSTKSKRAITFCRHCVIGTRWTMNENNKNINRTVATAIARALITEYTEKYYSVGYVHCSHSLSTIVVLSNFHAFLASEILLFFSDCVCMCFSVDLCRAFSSLFSIEEDEQITTREHF